MNWLRDNILKILIILGVTIVAIVVISLLINPSSKGDNVVSAPKYGELETKLQNAAIKYVNKHKSLLPTTTEKVTKIKLNTLQNNKYIGKLVAIEDSSVACDGYVEITKLNEEKKDYRYTPFISCGEHYITKAIGDYIIDTETKDGTFTRTSEEGLYKIGDEYVFRGENVKNYIMLDSHLYRIIKIDADNYVELISINRTSNSYVWDDRYNIERDRTEGINNFNKSRLHDSLVALYDNTSSSNGEVFFSETEKSYIVPYNYCTGKRSLNDTGIYSGAECKETTELKVGILSLYEYARASIDTNCKSVFEKSCANYNYFKTLGNKSNSNYNYMTMTGVLDNTYQYYRIRTDEVTATKTLNSSQLYPVIFINNKLIYASGTGTYEDPYIIR